MKNMWAKFMVAFLCADLLLALMGIQPAYAATFIVTNNNDSGTGSLRQAITDTNAAIGADTITFDSSLSGTTITLGSPLPAINDILTIDGSSLASPITISGNNSVQVMSVNNGKSLTINSLTIANGFAVDGGGITNNNGNLTITNSTFTNNSASDIGGGIINFGMLSVTNSTFSGNSSLNTGGGIFNFFSTLKVTNSTFSGNSASSNGGGIVNDNGDLTITNSTFSGNSAGLNGGIENYGTLNLVNTIIANSANGDCFNFGVIVTDKNNLIKDTGINACGLINGTNSDIIGSDPLLNSLADNGGKTQTMALMSSSPAIDTGDDTTCAASPVNNKDQRGAIRPQGAHCDIGSYEYGPVIPVVTTTTPAANATVSSPTAITVTFDQDMLNNGSSKAANDTANYLLVERGTNGVFDTQSCKGGVVSDDVQKIISSASYSNSGGNYVATLALSAPLSAGVYRLFTCGTTSIWSAAGLKLNNGANDTQITFTVSAASGGSGGGGSGSGGNASALPKTGFPMGQITALSAQPADKKYSSTDLILDIPSLNVKTNIVGVPMTNNTWDVSWLGNNAGWLNGSAFPTWNGNSVITGHVWNADNTPGIFVHLKDLKYGDQFQVQAFGQTYTYEVRESRTVWSNQVSTVMKHEDRPYITLVTCEDYNLLFTTYSFRRMVRAVLISVK